MKQITPVHVVQAFLSQTVFTDKHRTQTPVVSIMMMSVLRQVAYTCYDVTLYMHMHRTAFNRLFTLSVVFVCVSHYDLICDERID